ncbi:MAG: neutral zinc metallopeptidase [Kineosporiaceae bacterium]
MPIEFDDSRVDVTGVDDRRGRGMGGGLAIGGGTGIVGLIIVILVQVLGGGGQVSLPEGGAGSGAGSAESSEQLKRRCNGEGALREYTDCRLIRVYRLADDTWAEEFSRRGLSYHRPQLAFFEQQTRTGCGPASASVGPFYCPADQEIYLDLGFLDQLQQQFGAKGEFAQAYIVAHEYGHHLQTLLGTERKVRAAQERDPGRANEYSVAMELQADCYAGAWAKLADERDGDGLVLDQADVDEAVRAAEAVGDDRIQQKVNGRVDPESWTHGSAAERSRWFRTGFESGDLGSCTTFG